MELLYLFVLGTVAGFYGATVGASLLVLVPALLVLGLTPQIALGTAKVACFFRDVSALFQFHKQGRVEYRTALGFTFFGIIGTVIGSLFALTISERTLELLILGFSIAVALLLWRNPDLGTIRRDVSGSRYTSIQTVVLGLAAGLYAGIFGGGVNLVIIVSLICILGHDFLTATATSKIPNLVFAAVFSIIFIVHDQVDFILAIPLSLGMFLGGYLGSWAAGKLGNKFIRRLFFITVGAMLVAAVLR